MVAISALTMMEGRYASRLFCHFALNVLRLLFSTRTNLLFIRYDSIWRNVRGAGLAYGTSMDHDVFAGLLKLEIYRSSQPFAGKM